MRITGRLALALATVVATLLALAAPAAATGQETTSEPSGDFFIRVGVGATTDKDRDGDRDTATKPDKLFSQITVCQHFRQDQTVQLAITIDAPGTEFDRQLSRTADLVRFSCIGTFFIEDKVKNKWESGIYTVTVDATNGTDQATVSGSVAISVD